MYLTYLVAMMRAAGAAPTLVAMNWTLLGLGVITAPLLWRPVFARTDGGGALALACVATGAATLLPLGWQGSEPVLLLSAAAFGLSFFMAPTAVASFARKNLAVRPGVGRPLRALLSGASRMRALNSAMAVPLVLSIVPVWIPHR